MGKELDKKIVDEEMVMVKLGWTPERHNGVIVYTRDAVPPGANPPSKRIQKRKVAKTKKECQ